MQGIPNNRHSPRRLILALALSSFITASTLTLVPNPFGNTARSLVESQHLTVVLKQESIEVLSEITVSDYEKSTGSHDQPDTSVRQAAATKILETDPPQKNTGKLVSEQSANMDWYEIGRSSVHWTIDEYFENEETRKKMWHRTGSVMFADTGGFDFREPEPIIAAREFRRPVGVLGLGLTIGGCFFGIPLAGIPVEERGIGPNVVYCTDIFE